MAMGTGTGMIMAMVMIMETGTETVMETGMVMAPEDVATVILVMRAEPDQTTISATHVLLITLQTQMELEMNISLAIVHT